MSSEINKLIFIYSRFDNNPIYFAKGVSHGSPLSFQIFNIYLVEVLQTIKKKQKIAILAI